MWIGWHFSFCSEADLASKDRQKGNILWQLFSSTISPSPKIFRLCLNTIIFDMFLSVSATYLPTSEPRCPKSMVLHSERIGIFYFTVFYQKPILLKCSFLLPRPQLFFEAKIALWMKEPRTWVECFINHHQVLRVVFFLFVYDLPKINRTRNRKRVAFEYPHSVQVFEVVDSLNILWLGHVSKKAHPLQKSEPAINILVHHQLVLQKFI